MYTLKNSVGMLVSGKGPKGAPLSDTDLLDEFENHANPWNRELTALVSASKRIVDTVKRAFDKHFVDGESPADIWIAFIEVPADLDKTTTRIRSAKKCAGKCNLKDPIKFSHEVVFEWAIPEKYVIHEVSLETLMNRGLQAGWFSQPSTMDVRRCIAREFRQLYPWEIGLTLGFFAKSFGARVPLNWISHRLWRDSVGVRDVDDEVVVRLYYAHGCTDIVDFEFFQDLEDGIDTALCEWWLSDVDFWADCQEFYSWRDVTEEGIAWDLIDFWETWHRDGTVGELSAAEKSRYDEE